MSITSSSIIGWHFNIPSQSLLGIIISFTYTMCIVLISSLALDCSPIAIKLFIWLYSFESVLSLFVNSSHKITLLARSFLVSIYFYHMWEFKFRCFPLMNFFLSLYQRTNQQDNFLSLVSRLS